MNRTMHSLIQMTSFQFKGLYRNKIALFFNLAFPLILLTLFATAFSKNAMGNIFDHLIPGQLAVMLLSAGLMTLGISISIQRQSGAMRHLFSTPLSMGVWAATRVLANMAMALVQTAILFAFAALVFRVPFPADVFGTLVVVLVSAFVTMSMGLVVGTLAKGETAALALSMCIFMLLIFWGNAAMPVEMLPEKMFWVARMTPTYHMTIAMRAVIMEGSGLASALPQIGGLTAFGLALFGASLLKVRRQFVVA